MILLNPALESSPAPRTAPAKGRAASGASAVPRNLRLPSTRTLEQFLRTAQAAVRLRGQVSVLLTTDREIRRLNREFRGQDKATDVLSFPALATGFEPAEEMPAGDLAISVHTARRQAVEQGHALAVEIKVLLLHGLLHLAGYDHETDTGQMARRERKLRKDLGLVKGLIERVEAPARRAEKSRKAGAQAASGPGQKRPAVKKPRGAGGRS